MYTANVLFCFGCVRAVILVQNTDHTHNTMQLFIQSSDATSTLDVAPADTIASLKQSVEDGMGLPIEHQHLLSRGRALEDDRILSDYSIEDSDAIDVCLRVRGGRVVDGEDAPEPAAAPEPEPMAVDAAPAALTLTAAAERDFVAAAGATVTLAATIEASAVPEGRRPDVDVVVVLDRSGSMGCDRKLELCKETTELLVRELRGTDRFGLVTFDHNVTTNLELLPVSGATESAVRRLRPGGTTNLSGGLFRGLELLAAPSAQERVRTVLLLTDGHANAGVTNDAALVNATTKLLAGTTTSLYTFGYGTDHNADLLQAVAAAAGDGKGSYYFIEDADRVVGAFADCLGGLMSVVGQNCVVDVRATGATIARVRREGATRVDDTHWTVPLGDIFAEEERDVLVDLVVNDGSAAVDFSLRYVAAATGDVVRAAAAAGVAVDAARAPSAAPNERIAVHRARLDTADALKAARAHADAGRIDEARSGLEAMKARVAACPASAAHAGLVSRLKLDLDLVVESVRDARTYERRGKKQLVSKMMGHQMQRCMSDSDDEDDAACEGGAAPAPRNAYRGTAKAAMKSKWSRAAKPPPPPSPTRPPTPPRGVVASLMAKKSKKSCRT